jgi:RNA polymerase sigma-70 factor (ECF subfamily)
MRTDEQLMEIYVQCQDQDAFAELYERHAQSIERFVGRHVFRASDVEDIVQHTFMQVHVARQQYRSGEPVRPWMYAIAMNLCRDFYRRRQRKPEVALEMDRLGADEPVAEASVSVEPPPGLMGALESLSDITRRIFREHFLEDRALVDIARDLGANPSTVRVRLHRGCRTLRMQLAG